MLFSKEEWPSSTDPLSDERAPSDGPVVPEDIILLGGSAPPCLDILAASPLISPAIVSSKGGLYPHKFKEGRLFWENNLFNTEEISSGKTGENRVASIIHATDFATTVLEISPKLG